MKLTLFTLSSCFMKAIFVFDMSTSKSVGSFLMTWHQTIVRSIEM